MTTQRFTVWLEAYAYIMRNSQDSEKAEKVANSALKAFDEVDDGEDPHQTGAAKR